MAGTLWWWGSPWYLGDSAQSSPGQFGAAEDWAKIAFGYYHGAGIKPDGTLWVWGEGGSGELGLNSFTDQATPVQVGSGTNWVWVDCGYAHTVAVKADGTLWSTGANYSGQLGQGNTTDLDEFTQIGSATDWAKCFAVGDSTYVIKTTGALHACGDNTSGRLGDGSSIQRNSLVAIGSAAWDTIAGSYTSTIGVRQDGTLWSWGAGNFGKLGLGNTTSYNTPQQVGSATWRSAGIGAMDSVGIKTEGTLWVWGNSTTTPTQVGSATDWDWCVASNGLYAAKTDGTLHAWSSQPNTDGQLGVGDTSYHTTPTRIGTETTWGAVSAESTTVFALLEIPPAAEFASAPIAITVSAATGTARAPVRVDVRSYGSASAPVLIAVVDSLETATWSLSVSLDGADVSARLTGQLDVDAEEGAARVASFSLVPATGAINPLTWTGSPVIIDLLRVIGGVSVPSRLFTGRVDLASYDPTTRLVRFDCTDDLQNRVAALTVAEVDALVGGSYSVGAQGEIDERWAYAQARLESRPASLDAGPHGELRVTDWDGLATWRTFTAEDILDGEISIELPRRRDLVNRVDIAYEYRYHRLRERRASVTWSGTILGAAALASGYQFPSFDEVDGAIRGLSDWHVLSRAYSTAYDYIKADKPAGAPDGADADWWINGGGGISNYSARLAQRHAQPVTETYTLTVSAPASVDNNGTLAVPLRGALASEWDASAWESDLEQTPEVYLAGDMDYAPDAPRADSDTAIETLLAMAKTRILASHRQAAARFAVPCMPEIDLTLALAVDTATLDASGKVARVEHLLDIDSGAATTTVTLSLSGVAAGGISVTPTPLDAPTPPVIGDVTGEDDWASGIPHLGHFVGATASSESETELLMGHLVNAPERLSYYNFTLGTAYTPLNGAYSAASAYATTGFRVSMPGVASTHRDPVDLTHRAEYDIEIPEDPLTLTA